MFLTHFGGHIVPSGRDMQEGNRAVTQCPYIKDDPRSKSLQKKELQKRLDIEPLLIEFAKSLLLRYVALGQNHGHIYHLSSAITIML